MTDVTWDIEFHNNVVTADGANFSDIPRIGDEFDIEFFMSGPVGLEDYNFLREYVRYTTDENVDYGMDHRGNPYYRETTHPQEPDGETFDRLLKLVPSEDIPGVEAYWAVLVGGSDNTRFVGPAERVELTVLLLAETENLPTREDVVDEFTVLR